MPSPSSIPKHKVGADKGSYNLKTEAEAEKHICMKIRSETDPELPTPANGMCSRKGTGSEAGTSAAASGPDEDKQPSALTDSQRPGRKKDSSGSSMTIS